MAITQVQNPLAIVNELTQLDRWLEIVGSDGEVGRVDAGSSLIGDDRKTDPYYISHTAWSGFSHAVDHLHTLRTMIASAGVLHMYSPFALIRAAIENASKTVWLLSPHSREERIRRRLRLAAAETRNLEGLNVLIGSTSPRTLEERLDDLRKIATKYGIPEDDVVHRRNRPGYEDIVAEAGKSMAYGPTTAAAVWKVCSALAHGDQPVSIAMMERADIRTRGNVIEANASAPVGGLVLMTALTAAMVEKAWSLYDQRRRSYL